MKGIRTYRLYIGREGLCAGMNLAGATTGDGTSMDDFNRKFDGSLPLVDFDLPPEHDNFYEDRLPPLSEDQTWQLAQVVYRTVCEALENAPYLRSCPVHVGQLHGGEAEELRGGIEGLIDELEDEPDQIAVHFYREATAKMRSLLDRIDARDSLAHLEHDDALAEELIRILHANRGCGTGRTWKDDVGELILKLGGMP